MRKRKYNKKRKVSRWAKVFIAGLITATIAFVIFGLVDKGFRDVMTAIGITNFYLQGAIIIVILSLLLLVIGYKLRKAYIEAVK